MQGRVFVLHWPKCHHVFLTTSGLGEKWHTTSLHAWPWLFPRIFSGGTFSCLLGLGNADRFLHTYLPAERGTVVFDGDRWAMSESGSRATLISHVIGDEVVFAFPSFRPATCGRSRKIRGVGRPFLRPCWEILFKRQRSQ